MGDRQAPSSTESTAQVLQSYAAYLPQLAQVANSIVAPTELANLRAAQATSPAYAKLNLDQLKAFGPEYAQTGTNLDKIIKLGSSASDLATLRGPGGELAKESTALAKSIDPEYYKTRAETADVLSRLNSMLPTSAAPTEGELAAIERGVNRGEAVSGNVGNPNAINTVVRGMNFGQGAMDIADRRRAAIASAVNTASTFLPTSRSGFDVVQTALGRPSTYNAIGQFTGLQKTGDTASQFGSNALSNIFQAQSQTNDINSKRRDLLDRFNEVLSSMPSAS